MSSLKEGMNQYQYLKFKKVQQRLAGHVENLFRYFGKGTKKEKNKIRMQGALLPRFPNLNTKLFLDKKQFHQYQTYNEVSRNNRAT